MYSINIFLTKMSSLVNTDVLQHRVTCSNAGHVNCRTISPSTPANPTCKHDVVPRSLPAGSLVISAHVQKEPIKLCYNDDRMRKVSDALSAVWHTAVFPYKLYGVRLLYKLYGFLAVSGEKIVNCVYRYHQFTIFTYGVTSAELRKSL